MNGWTRFGGSWKITNHSYFHGYIRQGGYTRDYSKFDPPRRVLKN